MICQYFVTVHRKDNRSRTRTRTCTNVAELKSFQLWSDSRGEGEQVTDRFIDPVIGNRPIMAVMADGSRVSCVASKWIGNWHGRG